MLAHAGAADESLSVAMIGAAVWIGWVGWQRLKGRGFPRLPRAAAYGLLGVALVMAIGAAWLPRQVFPPGAAPTGAAPGPRISSTATLSFARPADDARVVGDQLDVVLDLPGGTVVEGASTDLSSDQGHLHLSVDGQLVSMTYGEVQVVDLRPWGPGRHTIEAEFVAADHLPFDPPVVATVEVTKG